MKNRLSVKNVKTHEGRQGIGLNMDVYLDGKKLFHVLDEANGGMFHFDVYGYDQNKDDDKQTVLKENRKLFNDICEYAKTLPPKKIESNGQIHKLDFDIELLIEELFAEHEGARQKKKAENKMNTCIVYGTSFDNYSYVSFNVKKPLKEIVNMKGGKEAVQKTVKTIESRLIGNQKILNTNLKELGILVAEK